MPFKKCKKYSVGVQNSHSKSFKIEFRYFKKFQIKLHILLFLKLFCYLYVQIGLFKAKYRHSQNLSNKIKVSNYHIFLYNACYFITKLHLINLIFFILIQSNLLCCFVIFFDIPSSFLNLSCLILYESYLFLLIEYLLLFISIFIMIINWLLLILYYLFLIASYL